MLTPAQQAIYRPLVKRAWLAHCRQTGTAPNNRPAYDAWYRDQVHGAVGLWSTIEADPARDYSKLIDRFLVLVGAVGGQGVTISGWTPKQGDSFSGLAARAWRMEMARGVVPDGVDFNDWLAELLRGAGIFNGKAPDRKESFDAAMAELAIRAGDDYWIGRTAAAAEIRLRYVLACKMDELATLTGDPVDWRYCRAIYAQMNLPLTIEEASAPWLWKLLQALDTHIRRLGRRTKKKEVDKVPF